MRLALVDHVVRSCLNLNERCGEVSAESMENGIALARWFSTEAERIFATLEEGEADRLLRRRIDWIQKRGGKTTARDLQRSNSSRYPNEEAARLALDEMVACELGEWRSEPTGVPGRFAQVMYLVRQPDKPDISTVEDNEQEPTLSDISPGPIVFQGENSDMSGLSGCRVEIQNDLPIPEEGLSDHEDPEAELERRLEREAIQSEGKVIG